MKAERRHNDFYPTPEWATQALMRHVGIRGVIFECCAGMNDIGKVLEDYGTVYTNDISPMHPATMYGDAGKQMFWPQAIAEIGEVDWVVTNPPFSVAPQIVPLAYEHAVKGIAMLLRLSYLEPVENRGTWLNGHPPTILIVLPRISFTNDGKTDNVTCAWMVWWKGHEPTRIIVEENPRFSGNGSTHQPVLENHDPGTAQSVVSPLIEEPLTYKSRLEIRNKMRSEK